MYQNLLWKLVPTVAIIALCVVIAVSGLPAPDNESGFLGFKLQLGQDLKGGTSLVYRMVHVEIAELDKEIERLEAMKLRNPGAWTEDNQAALDGLRSRREALSANFYDPRNLQDANEQTRDVLSRRLNSTGLAGVEVRPYGADRLMVTLPVDLNESIERIIESSGTLLFRMEGDRNPTGEGGIGEYTYPDNPDPERFRWYPIAQDKSLDAWSSQDGRDWVLIDLNPPNDPKLLGEDLANVYPTQDQNPGGGGPAVGFEFKTEGGLQTAFGELTGKYKKDNYTGKPHVPRLCTIFNEEVVWAGPIRNQILGSGIITGFSGTVEQMTMVNLIRSGGLPVRLEMEGKNTTGAGLGNDSIRQGLMSIGIGGALVLVFILFYYMGGGVVATLALVLNLFITVAAMVMFSATLTMPGIAGLILTVGMAIDANILIYERIREEKRKTGNLKDAVLRGFDRSTVTILDANLTTIITGLILYIVGTPEIVGFAVTLIIGILASLFTALVFSRFLVAALVASGSIRKFMMFQIVRNPRVPFMTARTPLFTMSTVVIVIGLLFFIGRGKDNLGIDFLGGHLFVIELDDQADVEDVRNAIASLMHEDGTPVYPQAQVTPAYHPGETGGGTVSDRFELRFPTMPDQTDSNAEIQRRVRRDIEKIFSGTYTFEGRDGPMPALVEPSFDLSIVDPTVVGFTLEIPLKSGVGEDAARNDVGPDLRYTELAYIEPSSAGALSDLGGEDGQAPVTYDYAVRGRRLIVNIGHVAVDPTTFGTADYDWETTFTERVAAFFAPVDDAGRADPESLNAAQKLGLVLDPEEAITVTAWPETAAMVMTFHLPEEAPLSASAFTSGSDGTVATGDGADNTLADAQIATRLAGAIQDELKALGGFGELRIPTTTNQEQPEGDWGLELKAGTTTPQVKGFRIFTGNVELAPTTDTDNQKRAAQVVDRIVRTVRTWLGENTGRSVSEPFLREQAIGSSIATDMQDKATLAIIVSLICIVFYIWIRFKTFAYGLGATIALAHDVMFALGAIAFFDTFTNWTVKIDLTVIAALLTIIGYSLNDTIVVYDRIRENRTGVKKSVSFIPYINTSVNQCLSRTLLTSLTTFIVVLVLFLFGGRVIEGFALTLLIGVLVGTYSSVFIASPVLAVDWQKYQNILYAFLGIGLVLLIIQAFAGPFIFLFRDTGLDLLVYSVVPLLIGAWVVVLINFFTKQEGTAAGDTFLEPAQVAAAEAAAEIARTEKPSTPEEKGDAPATADAAADGGEAAGDDADDTSDDDAPDEKPSGETPSDEKPSGEAAAATAEKAEDKPAKKTDAPKKSGQSKKGGSKKGGGSGKGGGGGKGKGKGGKGKGKGGKKGKKGK